MAIATVHLVGGGQVEVELDAADLDEVAERLRRERALIGHMMIDVADGRVEGAVLIPAYRVHLVRWP